MTEVVLSLGSNLGDREQTIRDAARDIAAIPGVVVVAASSLVQTPALKPAGVSHDAPAYLNAVLVLATDLDARVLLTELNRIESAHGRVREVRWGDRTLDIDIVTYGDETIATEELTIPHPRAAERAFVLAPWVEVRRGAALPEGSVAELLAATGDIPAPYDSEPLL